ncbi:MAG: hypothetical protein QOJ94_2841 [Sphingomonadales bacterium]|jgi:hypothetical protein|nr:hypothetical protein [Sphingomonadales bacterium]
MTRLPVATALLALNIGATLPPKSDPEGCDRVRESVKRAGSDLVVDGRLNCATDDGDCELRPAKIVGGREAGRAGRGPIVVHILRREARDYSDQLTARNEIAFCFPPELWFSYKGRYRGRFYLRREARGRYHMAFYPRETEE